MYTEFKDVIYVLCVYTLGTPVYTHTHKVFAIIYICVHYTRDNSTLKKEAAGSLETLTPA